MIIGLGDVGDYAGWVVGVLGGVTALGVIYRWARRRVKRASRKLNDAADTLLGREEIKHPDTGVVLVPATPGLGRRLAGIEQTLINLSDTRTELLELSRRVGDLAGQFDQHVTESQDLEMARVHEQSKMWDTIRTIAKAPAAPPWDGADRRGTGAKNAEQG